MAIEWPDGRRSAALTGTDWLLAAHQAGVSIPTGCLGGSCGACEIEVNGTVVRACIAAVPPHPRGELQVSYADDPHW